MQKKHKKTRGSNYIQKQPKIRLNLCIITYMSSENFDSKKKKIQGETNH